jgi:mycothiol synthase
MSVPVLRPLSDADVPAIVALFNEIARGGYGVEDESEQELRLWLESPTVDPARDVRVAVGPAGEIVGYADVYDQNDWHTRFWFDLRVHPQNGGLEAAAALLDWAEERVLATAKEGAFLRSFVPGRSELVKRTLEERGFALIRHSYRMGIALDGAAREPRWPEGVAVRPMSPGEERAVYEVNEECFADHWEHVEEPYEEWRHWTVERKDFDPDLWFLALAGDEIAGYALCRRHDALPDTGWVDSLGVRRSWRRRGMGRALLEHCFAEFRRRGLARAGLGVDAESLTGANRLYEQAGMEVTRRWDVYQRDLA